MKNTTNTGFTALVGIVAIVQTDPCGSPMPIAA